MLFFFPKPPWFIPPRTVHAYTDMRRIIVVHTSHFFKVMAEQALETEGHLDEAKDEIKRLKQQLENKQTEMRAIAKEAEKRVEAERQRDAVKKEEEDVLAKKAAKKDLLLNRLQARNIGGPALREIEPKYIPTE